MPKYYKFKDADNHFYKTVLMPIRVPQGNYCWDGYERICGYFDNEGGHGVCELDLGTLKRDKDLKYPKPKECYELIKASDI